MILPSSDQLAYAVQETNSSPEMVLLTGETVTGSDSGVISCSSATVPHPASSRTRTTSSSIRRIIPVLLIAITSFHHIYDTDGQNAHLKDQHHILYI